MKYFSRGLFFVVPFFFICSFLIASCSIVATRPSQEMSNMDVAIRSAKEVNADVLAPELYRLAVESSLSAKREYRFKNFLDAKKHADIARSYAEQAEFESIRNGGKREQLPQDPLAEPSYAPEVVGTPNPDASPSSGNKTTIKIPGSPN
jgi:hypothetical protein